MPLLKLDSDDNEVDLENILSCWKGHEELNENLLFLCLDVSSVLS